jgi:hypothetical protein
VTFLFLGVALLAGALLAGRWFSHADPKVLIKVFKWCLVGLVIVVALFFVFSGRFGLAMISLPALLPWFLRLRQAARIAKTIHRMAQHSGSGPYGGESDSHTGQTGETSEVSTDHLTMVLDHDTGAMHGEVKCKLYQGRTLDSLGDTELMILLRELRLLDSQSAQLLETYLNREHPDWLDSEQAEEAPPGAGRSDGMSRAEALQVLGLDETADTAEIRDAHHHLITSMHPDKGGSTYLAAKINQAKDTLLK